MCLCQGRRVFDNSTMKCEKVDERSIKDGNRLRFFQGIGKARKLKIENAGLGYIDGRH